MWPTVFISAAVLFCCASYVSVCSLGDLRLLGMLVISNVDVYVDPMFLYISTISLLSMFLLTVLYVFGDVVYT